MPKNKDKPRDKSPIVDAYGRTVADYTVEILELQRRIRLSKERRSELVSEGVSLIYARRK